MSRDVDHRIQILEQQVQYLLDHYKPRKRLPGEPIMPPPRHPANPVPLPLTSDLISPPMTRNSVSRLRYTPVIPQTYPRMGSARPNATRQ